MPINQFFSTIEHFNNRKMVVPSFIQNKHALRSLLHRLEVYKPGKYLHDHYTYWLSAYARQAQPLLKNYFIGKVELNPVCQNFIQFCFNQGISLDKDKTLQSFEHHDAISDNAVKKELANIKQRHEINL